MTPLENKTFDFVSALTGVVVLVYLGAWIYAVATGQATITELKQELSPYTLLLIGYWVRKASA